MSDFVADGPTDVQMWMGWDDNHFQPADGMGTICRAGQVTPPPSPPDMDMELDMESDPAPFSPITIIEDDEALEEVPQLPQLPPPQAPAPPLRPLVGRIQHEISPPAKLAKVPSSHQPGGGWSRSATLTFYPEPGALTNASNPLSFFPFATEEDALAAAKSLARTPNLLSSTSPCNQEDFRVLKAPTDSLIAILGSHNGTLKIEAPSEAMSSAYARALTEIRHRYGAEPGTWRTTTVYWVDSTKNPFSDTPGDDESESDSDDDEDEEEEEHPQAPTATPTADGYRWFTST